VERNPLTGHRERWKKRRVKSSMDHYGFLFFVSDSVKGEEWKWNDIRVCRWWEWWERLVRKEFLNKRPPEKGEYLPYCNDTTGREEKNPCLSPISPIPNHRLSQSDGDYFGETISSSSFPLLPKESRLQGLQVGKKPYLTVKGWDRRPKILLTTDDPVWILSSRIPTDSLEERWGREGKDKECKIEIKGRGRGTRVDQHLVFLKESWWPSLGRDGQKQVGRTEKPSGKGKKWFFHVDSWLHILSSHMRDERSW